MIRKLTAIGLIGLATHSTNVQAIDFDPSVFSVNGFGTFGAVYSSEDQALFTANSFQARGAGFENKISTDVDTRLGLQALARLSDKLTFTVQLVSEQNIEGKYEPKVEWANLKYQFTPSLSVRAGRTAMPSYMFSDSRKVGYATPWVRAPREVYDMLPITNSDGIDVSYRAKAGPVTTTVQAIYGENIADVGMMEVKAKHVWGVFNTTEIDDLTLKVTYQEQKLYYGSYKLPNLIFPPDIYQTEASPVEFMAIGAHYDPGQWFASAEWAKRKIDDSFMGGKLKGWYITGGYRLGEFTPYATVAEQKPEDLDPMMVAMGAPSTEQRSYTAGARWDFMSGFSLKAEYQYIDLPKGSNGLFTVPFDPVTFMPLTSFQPGGSADVLSVSINFVF